MATVAIRYLPEQRTEFGDCVGEIRIGDFVERFPMSVFDVSPDLYIAQWKRTQARFATVPARGCFLASVLQPAAPDGRVFWWIFYRDGDAFVFQNHLLLMSAIDGAFDVEQPERWIPPRETLTEDGQRISEWRVPIAGLVVEVSE